MVPNEAVTVVFLLHLVLQLCGPLLRSCETRLQLSHQKNMQKVSFCSVRALGIPSRGGVYIYLVFIQNTF